MGARTLRHGPWLLALLLACGDDDRARADGGFVADGGADVVLRDVANDGPPDVRTADASSDASVDGGMPDVPSRATIDLTFSGCAPDFSGDNVVVYNGDSIAVSSTTGGGSVQLALQDERGQVDLGTRHRVDTGAVVNVVVASTWTNIAMDSAAVLGGSAPDPIGGTLRVDSYDEAAGMLDVTFESVTLQNPSDGTLCNIEGRLQTSGLSF